MSLVSGILALGLPDDPSYNILRIYSCPTENGSYTLVENQVYEYPAATTEFNLLDETLYYKIQYYNGVTSKVSALSDPVAGSKFSQGAPFFTITSKTDGISYSSVEDFYKYTRLTPDDADTDEILNALKKARAYMDLKLGETDLSRFTDQWNSNVSRRKFNAALELSKECEINLAASIIFKNMSDIFMLQAMRGERTSFASISIGSSALQNNNSSNPIDIANFLTSQSIKYAQEASAMMTLINSTKIPTNYNINNCRNSRFIPPWCS